MAAILVTSIVIASVVVVRLAILAAAGEPETSQSSAFTVGAAAGEIESLVVLDWDAGTADWENVTDETVVGEVQFRNPATLDTVATIATGYDPQIAVSGDGSRLFLAETISVDLTPVQRIRVFDLSGGIDEIASLSIEDRLLTTGDVAPGIVASSYDGSYVFVQGHIGNSYWVDAYDVAAGGASLDRVQLPDFCGIATILPGPAGAQFVAICKGVAASVTIADSLSAVATVETIDGVTESIGGVPTGGSGGSLVSAVVARDGSAAYVLSRDGTLRSVDMATGLDSEVHELDLGGGFVSPGQVVLSGGLLYVGVGDEPNAGEGRSASIRAFSLASLSLQREIESPVSFSSLAVSSDGGLIYVVDRRSRQMAVIDVETGDQVGLVSEVGGVPDFIFLR